MAQLMHRVMLRLPVGLPGGITVLHLQLLVSIRNWCTVKDFMIAQYPKRHEEMWVYLASLS